MKNNSIYCPICGLKSEKEFGKISCLDCNSLFKVLPEGEVKLIKANKLDIWSVIIAAAFPIGIVVLFFHDRSSLDLNSTQKMVIGLMMLLYPLISFLYMISRNLEEDLIFGLYSKFFRKKLSQQNKGKIIAFYITFVTNIIGLVLIVWSIVERIVRNL